MAHYLNYKAELQVLPLVLPPSTLAEQMRPINPSASEHRLLMTFFPLCGQREREKVVAFFFFSMGNSDTNKFMGLATRANLSRSSSCWICPRRCHQGQCLGWLSRRHWALQPAFAISKFNRVSLPSPGARGWMLHFRPFTAALAKINFMWRQREKTTAPSDLSLWDRQRRGGKVLLKKKRVLCFSFWDCLVLWIHASFSLPHVFLGCDFCK